MFLFSRTILLPPAFIQRRDSGLALRNSVFCLGVVFSTLRLPSVARFCHTASPRIVRSVWHKVSHPTHPLLLASSVEKVIPGETWQKHTLEVCVNTPKLLQRSPTLREEQRNPFWEEGEARRSEEENGFCAIGCLQFGIHCYQLTCLMISLQSEKFISV